MQWQPPSGLLAGAGVIHQRKYGDHISGVSDEVNAYATRNSHQSSLEAEARIGYSTVPGYQRGQYKAPLSLSLDYVYPMRSVNKPIASRIQMDFSLYF